MKGVISYLEETGRKEVGSADLAMAIHNNGFKILSKPKYAAIIKHTVPAKMFDEILWLDAHGNVVASSIPFPDYDYPVIGEVIQYDEATERFKK